MITDQVTFVGINTEDVNHGAALDPGSEIAGPCAGCNLLVYLPPTNRTWFHLLPARRLMCVDCYLRDWEDS